MIVVFGSINADLFFTVDRLPVAGETVLTPSVALEPGGKGANQAAAAARAGGDVRFVGCVGQDPFADPMVAALADSGCDVSAIRRVDGATGTAAVMVETGGENQIVVASGANARVTADLVDEELLGPETTLVCQMEVPAPETAEILKRAGRAGARTILNLAPALDLGAEVLGDVDVLVANAGEAAVLAGAPLEPAAAARHLAAAHALTCVVTDGSNGAVAVERDLSAWRVGVLAVDAMDTVGAGDAFVGGLASALDGGGTLADALRRASVGAALACTRRGAMAALPSRSEIEARMADLPPSGRLQLSG